MSHSRRTISWLTTRFTNLKIIPPSPPSKRSFWLPTRGQRRWSSCRNRLTQSRERLPWLSMKRRRSPRSRMSRRPNTPPTWSRRLVSSPEGSRLRRIESDECCHFHLYWKLTFPAGKKDAKLESDSFSGHSLFTPFICDVPTQPPPPVWNY